MSQAYKAVVFDLDGTLLDTIEDLWAAVNAALEVYGLPLRSLDEVRAFVGNGIKNLMQRAIGREDFPDFNGVFENFKKYYGAHCADRTKPYAGIKELLQELKARGVHTAVLSNKADFATKMLAEQYFSGLLEEAAGENEAAGIRKKPAPDALFAMMERMGVTAAETVYVGDSEVDIQTAKNAGVDCISVTWGFRSREILIDNGGTVLLDTPLEVLQYCKEK